MVNITKWVVASLLAVVVVSGVSSCGKKTEGPKPTPLRLSPKAVCSEQLNTWVTVTGSGFSPSPKDGLTDDSLLALPQLSIAKARTLNGAAAPRPTVVLNADVTDSTVSRVTWTSQSEMSFLVDQTPPLASGIYDLSIRNPTGGEGILTDALVVVPPPRLDSAEPAELCASPLETTITLTGTGFLFLDGAAPIVAVTVGATTVIATSVTMVEDACEVISGLTDSYTCTQVTATLGAGAVADEGVYAVSVTNPGTAACSSDIDAQFTVVAAPLIFSLDPPAVYNGISIRETIYVAGLDEAPQGVNLVPSGGGTETALTSVAWDAAKPNEVKATVPAGLAAGTYDLVIVNDGCNAVLSGEFTVVATPAIALLNPAVTPPFGQEQTSVAVNIVAKEDADLAAGEVNFSPTPRVYISNAAMAEAVPVRAVTFDSSSQLSAVIPELAAGQYDITVVNIIPGGTTTVGFAQSAYRATAVAPPIVSDVSPTLIGADAGQQVIVRGENFNNPQVTLECRDGSTPTATVSTASLTSLDVTIDGSGLNTGVTCVVRVTNSVDETWDEWSAISALNPAANIGDFIAGENMNTARRAPALAVGSATRKARFLYAIGGDDGDAANAMTSMEAAAQGRFGDINKWRTLQTALPAGRTMARAKRYNNFIYHMGGMGADGTATDEILRAEILDPLNVPHIDDIDISFDPEGSYNGLTEGSWTYAVAPVYAATDSDNPGGEGLPSETFTLHAPSVPGGVYVSLSWATVFGADGATPAVQYRIYRTAAANQIAAEMRLLATVDAADGDTQHYSDENPTMADTTKAPLLTGALGEWHSTGAALNTPRAAFAFTNASETGCDDRWIAFGGITDTATESATYEVIDPATMTAVQFTATGVSARRELGIWVANNENSISAALGACEYYLYAGPGASGALTAPVGENNVFVATATDTASGELGAFIDGVAAGSERFYGYDAFWSRDKVYVMGGFDNTGTDNVLDGAWSSEPVLQNMNSASASLTQPRYLFGFARYGAFAYLAGGVDETGLVTATTEHNVR